MVPIPGTEQIVECDALILSVGLIPENELAEGLGDVYKRQGLTTPLTAQATVAAGETLRLSISKCMSPTSVVENGTVTYTSVSYTHLQWSSAEPPTIWRTICGAKGM